MVIEYDLDDVISLPNVLFEKFLDGYHIIIAPLNPNWIVLKDAEYKMFKWLQLGATIRKALEKYYIEFCQDEEKCLSIMTKLLDQINAVDFSANAVILNEEPITKLKKKVHIVTTNGCNLRCKHCYMAAGLSPLKTVNLEKTVRIVKGLSDIYGRLEVVVSGGEPLTYKYINNLLKQIRDNYIILFTNGSLITLNNIEMIAEYCDEVQISFEGLSKESYGLIRGANNYESVLQALDLLKEHQVKIVIAITVLPSTIKDISNNLIDFVKSLNYKNLEVRISDEIELSGNALTMDLSSYDEIESKTAIIEMVRKLQEIGCVISKRDIRNMRFTNCGIGTNVVINFDGKIYPCHKYSDYALPDDTEVDMIIKRFNSLNNMTSNDNINKCHNCELRYICSGGCRIDNYIKTDNMNNVICNEEFKNKQFRRLIIDYRMYREKAD